jgi:nucleoside-diphosphate-sugar epimerase
MGAPDLVHLLPTFHNNLQTTVNLLTVAAEIGCHRLVLAGSLAEPEIGDLMAAVPSSPYAAAKFASSAYARMFHALYQLPVVILRVFMVYGPGQKDFTKLIPYVTLSCLQRTPPKITSGERLIDWIYVDDVIEGFIAAAQAPSIEGHTIDIGSGKLISIHEIVQQLVTLIGGEVQPLFGTLPDRPLEPIRVANVANTEARLGWKPKFSLEEGLLTTIDWYRQRFEEQSS